MSRIARFVAVGLVALVAGGCGYALSGRGSFLPEYIQTLGIPVFVNNTTVFDVEQALTQRVRQEFIGRGRYKVVPGTAGADAVLTGTITSVSLAPSAFNDQQQATRYAVTVVIKFEFRDMRENKLLWENPALLFRDEYDLPSGGSTSLDANAFFGQEGTAIERLANNFAKSVVTSILEAF